MRTKYIVFSLETLSNDEVDTFKEVVCTETDELSERPDVREILPITLKQIMEDLNVHELSGNTSEEEPKNDKEEEGEVAQNTEEEGEGAQNT